jgi:hypothetical protein
MRGPAGFARSPKERDVTTVTYFITGLRVTDPVTFTLTSATPPPNPMPDLKVRSKVGGDSSVAAVEKTWTVPLGAGDHILWIEGPDDDQWLGAALALTSLSRAGGPRRRGLAAGAPGLGHVGRGHRGEGSVAAAERAQVGRG